MTKRTTTHRLAGTAIAAVLALSTTPIWAQDAAPAAEAPASVAAPVAPPAPTIVLPPVAASPAPVADSASVESPSAPRAAPSKAAGTRTTSKTAVTSVRRVAPAAAAPTAAAPVSEPASVPPIAETQPLPSDIAASPVTAAEPATSKDSRDLLLAGLAGALGLGAIGLFAAARRRRRAEPDYAVADYEPVSESIVPVAEVPQPVEPTHIEEPARVTPRNIDLPQPRYATLAAPAFTPLKSWSEPKVQRAQPLDDRAFNLNREALLDRMVAAEPDANNPFTSAKARRKRARIMLQSMDNDRWEDAELAPGFDWRKMAQEVEKKETVDA
ncbi:hypothetical protein [Novosphingobium sp. Gsoil 351]|uniref:hypothetical protein n=1 Tax=Novosphingobium sp. Gsoil 351 TaxID=2675225 RepID=UPI0012B4753D|nr:hypothetical protein [Novosphingobium sp. Gsoil 351]QGN55959.1 hypothetical protein GKE62_16760 [Novosphingobium sp. Gsoil 351]